MKKAQVVDEPMSRLAFRHMIRIEELERFRQIAIEKRFWNAPMLKEIDEQVSKIKKEMDRDNRRTS